jgi:CheY-like chemotaxis protein
LIVDDEALYRTALARMLHQHGHYVLQVGTAVGAIDMLLGQLKEEVDVVILDLNLGTTMGGAEVARALVDRRPDLPVIAVTGMDVELIRWQAQQNPLRGIHIWLEKPYKETELLEQLGVIARAKGAKGLSQ